MYFQRIRIQHLQNWGISLYFWMWCIFRESPSTDEKTCILHYQRFCCPTQTHRAANWVFHDTRFCQIIWQIWSYTAQNKFRQKLSPVGFEMRLISLSWKTRILALNSAANSYLLWDSIQNLHVAKLNTVKPRLHKISSWEHQPLFTKVNKLNLLVWVINEKLHKILHWIQKLSGTTWMRNVQCFLHFSLSFKFLFISIKYLSRKYLSRWIKIF